MDRLLPWLRRSGWAYVAAAVVLAVLAWRVAGDGGGGQPDGGAPVRVVQGAAARQTLVHVAGEVRRPGVYRIGGDARVIQAVRLAGGPTRRADLSGLNLAALVQDGQQVVVPRRAPPGAAAAGTPGGGRGPVSLSRATPAELEALDGIGPALAARIVAWRQAHGGFASVDQLGEVPGIGDVRLEALRAQVVP
ncbi:MAG: ComEA family DNA-binding protein [Gammaproteobacteria bacterium]|jgi:competence protein ComEA|nr:ComEA family DNA-binding protein [Gammaproteobacteria bacterium]